MWLLLLFISVSAILALMKPVDGYKQNSLLQRDVNLQIRGILALLIVFHHITKVYSFPLFGQGQPLGEVVVAIFFFFSGYGILKQFEQKRNVYLDGLLKNI